MTTSPRRKFGAQFKAEAVQMVVQNDRPRKALSKSQITEVTKWRTRNEELSLPVARAEAIRLAKHVIDLGNQLTTNEKQLAELVQVSEAGPLPEETGFKAISAAKCLSALSHPRPHSYRGRLCLLSRNQPYSNLLRKHSPTSTQPRRRPRTQQCPAHGCHHQNTT